MPLVPFVPLLPPAPVSPFGPFWLHVIWVSTEVQWLDNELLGPEGSISRIVPTPFSLQAV